MTVTPQVPVAPTSSGVTPTSGSGGSQTFTVEAASAAGYGDLALLSLLIHGGLSGAEACARTYAPHAETIGLWNDAGAIVEHVPLTSGAPLTNSQCRLTPNTISVARQGTTLTVSVPIAFTGAFAGAKQVCASVQALNGLNAGWVTTGTWTVPAHTLTVGTVTPASGHGMTPTFTADFSRSYGMADVQQGNLQLVAPGAPWAPLCDVAVNFFTHEVWLLNDTWTGWVVAPIGGGLLATSRCQVPAGAVMTTVVDATTRRAQVPITFLEPMLGATDVLGLIHDAAWADTAWHHRGTWTVGPRLDSVSPGAVSVTQPLDLHGVDFGPTAGPVTVHGVPADVVSWSDTLVRLVVPPTTSGDVVVMRSGVASNAVPVTVIPGR